MIVFVESLDQGLTKLKYFLLKITFPSESVMTVSLSSRITSHGPRKVNSALPSTAKTVLSVDVPISDVTVRVPNE